MKLFIDDAGAHHEVEVQPGQTVLDVLQAQRVDIQATCGGVGKCRRCQVLVKDDTGLNYRLACTTPVSDGMEVVVERAGTMEVLQSGGIDPVEGTRELIRALHEAGVPLGLATSSHPPVMNAILDNFEIRKYFTSVISGGELPESKPNPAIYLISAERLGAKPENCCVLEDTTNGILAAKRAGMYCIAFHNPHSGEQDLSLADRVVEKIAEIEVEELLSLPLGEGC